MLPPPLLALVAGLYAGAIRIGWPLKFAPSLVALHGPLIVDGFFGSLIGVEKAVAHGGRWPYLAPLPGGIGTIGLLIGLPKPVVCALVVAASVTLTAVAVHFTIRQPQLFTLAMAVGAAAWLIGNLLWAAGSHFRL